MQQHPAELVYRDCIDSTATGVTVLRCSASSDGGVDIGSAREGKLGGLEEPISTATCNGVSPDNPLATGSIVDQ